MSAATYVPTNLTRAITWQFSTGDSDISKAIRWKTRSEISHVDVVTPDNKLLGAHIADGVLKREPDYMKFTLTIRVHVQVTEEQYNRFWQGILPTIGQAYNRLGILGMALSENMTDPTTVYCSELQSRKIDYAKIVHIAKEFSQVSPEELRLILSAIPTAIEQRSDR